MIDSIFSEQIERGKAVFYLTLTVSTLANIGFIKSKAEFSPLRLENPRNAHGIGHLSVAQDFPKKENSKFILKIRLFLT